MKLIALYQEPADREAFDGAYFGSHFPLIEKVPGLENIEITRFERTLIGSTVHLMAEMYFPDEQTLKAALRSSEMEAAGANLDSFAEGQYSLHYGYEG